MRIRGLVDTDFSARGAKLALRTGEAIEAPDEAAEVAIAHGFAEPCDEAAAPDAVQAPPADEGEGTPDPASEDDDSDEEYWPESMSSKLIDALEAAGLGPSDIATTSDQDLLAIDGLGDASLRALRDAYGRDKEA